MEGYQKLGRLMGDHPEYAVFRRFGALNMEILLYMQAEIRHLEIALRKQQKEDQESNHEDRTRYSRDWWTLKEANEPEAEPGNDGRQWKIILQMREKLQQYSTMEFLIGVMLS